MRCTIIPGIAWDFIQDLMHNWMQFFYFCNDTIGLLVGGWSDDSGVGWNRCIAIEFSGFLSDCNFSATCWYVPTQEVHAGLVLHLIRPETFDVQTLHFS
jgi:hypothetical protein